ncbi:MAG: IclR family transcriptional regulator [Dehalobacterium sp.]
MNGKPNYTLGTLEKAFNILDLFSPQRPELSLQELKDILGVPKTTVFRLLFTMEKHGFVRRVGNSGSYRLGLKLLYLGNVVSKDYDIVRIASPFMKNLRDELGETVDLTIINNDQVLLIEEFESVYRLKAGYSQVGKKLPLHCTASGKILASYSWEKISSRWPPKILPAYTSKTITDPDVLKKELELVLERGYAMDDEELDVDIMSYSAPIFDRDSSVPAALTVVAPKSRLSSEKEETIIRKVCYYASIISNELSKFG